MFIRKKNPNRLRLGFVALTDAAPIIAASEFGHFKRNGLEVELSREIGWATMRDKVLYGELDAAHALGGMLFSTALGVDSPAGDVVTACVLSLHGNAITLSRGLWDSGVRTPQALRDEIRRVRSVRKLHFGVVYPSSFHHVQLREWMRTGGIDPDHDVRIVIVPPAQMFRNLAAGTIDGCCVGEPWNSLAVAKGAGRIVTWSARQFPAHIEKVLMVRSTFAENRAVEHSALIRALVSACAWCDEPQNRKELVRLLAEPRHLNLPAEYIAPALTGPFSIDGQSTIPADDLIIFHRNDANAPRLDRADALFQQLVDSGVLPAAAAYDSQLVPRLFRSDLFTQIQSSTAVGAPVAV